MSDTSQNKDISQPTHPMPRGLPRSIGIDQSGYQRLNDFLGITRKRRKALLENKSVRKITRSVRDEISGKRLPAGERDRRLLLRLYGDPKFRQSMWESTFEMLEHGEEITPKRIPTIEHIALWDEFSGNYLNEESKSIVKEEFGEWPELVERISDDLPWADFAAVAWKQLNQQLESETLLSDHDKELLTIQIFSIATIVNDKRLILSAVRRAEWLEHEFTDLLENSKSVAEDAQIDDHSTNLTDKWNQFCSALSSVVDEASGEVPKLEALAEMKKLIEELNSLEAPLRAEIEKGQYSEFLTDLKSFFSSIENESCFAWLNEDLQNKLENRWREAWDSIAPNLAENVFSELNKHVQDKLQHNRATAASLEYAKQKLESLGDTAPSDFEERHQWEEDRDEAQRHVIDFKQDVRNAEKELYRALDPANYLDNSSDLIDQPTIEEPITTLPVTEIGDPSEQKIKIKEQPDSPPPTEQPQIEKPPKQPRKVDDVVDPPKAKIKKKPKPPPKKRRPNEAVNRIAEALLETPPNLAYAYQVARLAQKVDKTFPPFETVALKTALYSNCLRHPDRKIALALQTEFGKFSIPSEFEDDSARDTFSLLTLAATLRPSLLAPISGAFGFLSGIRTSSDLESVYSFANTVSQKTNVLQNVRIDSLVLRGTRSEASWENEYSALTDEAQIWKDQSRQVTFNYTPANRVWQHWQNSDEILGRLLSYVPSQKKMDTSVIESSINEIENRKSFEKLVRSTDRQELQRKRGEDISTRVLSKLHNRALEVANFARRRLSLEKARSPDSDFLTDTLNELRIAAEAAAPDAIAELKGLVNADRSLLAGAANTALHAINRFMALFDPDHNSLIHEPDPEIVIASGLFQFCNIPISDAGTPVHETSETLEILHQVDTTSTVENWFEQRLTNADLSAAEQILTWITTERPEEKDRFLEQFQNSQTKHKRELSKKIDAVREKVEIGLAYGYVPDADRHTYDAKLVKWGKISSDDSVFRMEDARSEFLEIESQLGSLLQEQKNKALSELDGLDIDRDEESYIQIAKAIDNNDIVSANEMIDRVRNGEPITNQETKDTFEFSEFFPTSIRNIDNALEKISRNTTVITRIKGGDKFAGLNFGRVSGAQRNSAARMLTAWYQLKSARNKTLDIREKVKEVFSELGFLIRDVQVDNQMHDYCEVRLTVEPLEERVQCSIPAYGSRAGGKYRVVVLWSRPAVEDILRFADDGSVAGASIVLYMGRLTEEKRRKIAKMSRDNSKNLLVIDESLLVFLCAETGSRIPTLFSCTIPFSYVQPFVTAAGLVPPEMFYGRQLEMQEVADPLGPCFIYGGRQLGKTALLRSVERNVHQPGKKQFALWMDLNAEGIGHDREPGEIWSVLWRQLKTIGAIDDDQPEPNPNVRGRIDNFVSYLMSQFAEQSGRTLLLLLDEADRFLESDAREERETSGSTGYRESSRLKGLMDGTKRSIKVVFAGLHNVLRTVEYSNHPLGHFGKPIQIGPLLSDGAWRSAEALLRDPMLAAGYKFDPPNLITRVLAQTNYYPSLIQLYGEALIKAMVPHRISGAPLYSINEDVLDETYQNRNLREMIRSRFHLTLQLDTRYEIIAYSLANSCMEHSSVLSEGLDHQSIHDSVRNWWSEGFRDIDTGTERFRSLLDEMVGLGVLRITQNKRYTLRNPNILLLMGSEDEITDNLLREREPSQEFNREIYRARDPNKPDTPRRSPLTFYQEDHLRKSENRVTVLCGLQASGLDDVVPFLKSRNSEDRVIELVGVFDRSSFEKKLKQLGQDRPKGTTVYIVPNTEPWSEEWVDTALNRMSKLRAKGRYFHVLFLADGAHLWRLQTEFEQLHSHGLKWLTLKPWREEFLRQWMEDVGLGDNKDTRTDIVNATSLWSGLLMRMYELTPATGEVSAGLEQLNIELGRKITDGSMQAEFGLDDPDSQRTLRALAIFGEADFEELQLEVAAEGINSETLNLRLKWAERLGLIRYNGQGIWEFDPVAAKAISGTTEVVSN